MDVDDRSFPARLLDILEAISESYFVSFDLELSGVPVKQPGKNPGKPSLQERYLETKAAAEKYHILQIGLTCVKEDVNSGAYVLRPYNFNLSPVVPEDFLRLERTISFHSGAIDFLVKQGFNFNNPIAHGVPYLSRTEAQQAQERASVVHNRADIADIVIKQEDVQALAHLNHVRSKMDEWIEGPSSHQLLLQPPQQSSEFNRYEMRLIHQLVRNEYPGYVSVPSRGQMRIYPFNAEREEYYQAQRLQKTQERIVRQTGFRWVVEALCGNPIQDIKLDYFAQTPSGAPAYVNFNTLKSRLVRVQHAIKGKKSVLIGHNLFLDLIYLYKTFVGDLPDTVERFAALIHEIFPVIVDTKYMATHKCGDINPQSSLSDIADQLEYQEYPHILIHGDHGKYHETAALHEAGYDSMLTAQIAVRLSAKLEQAGTYLQETENAEVPSPMDEAVGGVQLVPQTIQSAIHGLTGLFVSSSRTPSEGGGPDQEPEPATVPQASISQPILPAADTGAVTIETGHEADEADMTHGSAVPVKSHTFSPSPPAESNSQQSTGSADAVKTRKEKKNERRKAKKLAGKIVHSNVYELLDDKGSSSPSTSSGNEEPLQGANVASPPGAVVGDTDGVADAGWDGASGQDWDDQAPKPWENGKGMPRFTSEFWRVYGNKLRVFGTSEGVAMLE